MRVKCSGKMWAAVQGDIALPHTTEHSCVYACVQFEHLDGHKVKLEASEVTIPGQVFKVDKEGMPMFDHPDKTGDLYVTITVAFPKKLSQTQKDQIRKHFSQLHDEL